MDESPAPEVHTYVSVRKKRYVRKKTGEVVDSVSIRTIDYACRLHHPDAAEMRAVAQELADGATKKAVAARHRIGTVARLNRLLARFDLAAEPAAEEAPRAPFTPRAASPVL